MAEMTFEQFLAERKTAEEKEDKKREIAIATENKSKKDLFAKLEKLNKPGKGKKKDTEEINLTQLKIQEIVDTQKYREEEQQDSQTTQAMFEREQSALADMAKAIEKNSGIAEKNDDYIKAKEKLEKKVFQAQLKEASPGRKKELLKEEASRNKKNLTVLQRISTGIRGLGDKFMEGAGKALDSGFLKGAALIALLFLLPKILNSETFKKGVKFIETSVIPNIKKFVQFLEDSFGEKGPIIAGLLGITALLAPTLMFKGFSLAIKGLRLAFIAVKFFINNQLTRALLEMLKNTRVGRAVTGAIGLLTKAFVAIKVAMVATFKGIAAALSPLLVPAAIVIGIIAAIATVLYGIVDAVVEIQETFKETGSIMEAIKAGFARFFSSIVGVILGIPLKLVGFILKLFGFKNLAEKLPSIGELSDMIFGGIMRFFGFIQDMIMSIVDFFMDNKLVRFLLKKFGNMSDEEIETRSAMRKQAAIDRKTKIEDNRQKIITKNEKKREIEAERDGKGRFLTVDENRQAQLNEMEQRTDIDTAATAPVIINNDSSIRSSSSNTQNVNETITPRDGLLVSATADF